MLEVAGSLFSSNLLMFGKHWKWKVSCELRDLCKLMRLKMR